VFSTSGPQPTNEIAPLVLGDQQFFNDESETPQFQMKKRNRLEFLDNECELGDSDSDSDSTHTISYECELGDSDSTLVISPTTGVKQFSHVD
jgi:hypothetical protein